MAIRVSLLLFLCCAIASAQIGPSGGSSGQVWTSNGLASAPSWQVNSPSSIACSALPALTGAVTSSAGSCTTSIGAIQAGTGIAVGGTAPTQTITSNAESTLTYEYDATIIVNSIANFTKVVNASTVDNVTLSATSLTCSGNPTVALLNCAASTTCTSPTTIASGTITATGTATLPTVSNPAITAGQYVAWEVTGGTCTVAILHGNAQLHSN